MQAFLASDVVYSQRVIPYIKETLDSNDIGGQQIATSSFLPSLGWLEPRRPSASQLNARRRRPQPRTGRPRRARTATASTRSSIGGEALQPSPAVNRIPAGAGPDVRREVHQPGRERRDRRPRAGRASPASGKPITADARRSTRRRPARPPRRRSRSDTSPPIGTPVTIKVQVVGVPGEKKLDNNKPELHGDLPALARSPSLRRRGRRPDLDGRHRRAGCRRRRAHRADPRRDRAWSGCAACARTSASCSAATSGATSSSRPRSSSAASATCTRYVEDVAGTLDRPPGDRRGAPRRRDRLPRAWSATTPTTRCPASSRRRSRCSTRGARASCVSSIHHRDQARVYAKQVIDGKGELQLSPEEEEAVRIALGGGLSRARRIPRPGGHVHRARRPQPRRAVELVPFATVHDVVVAVARRDGRARRRADRELARGRGQRDARRARRGLPRRRDRRRVRPRRPPGLIAREPMELGDDRGGGLASAGARASARASCASSCRSARLVAADVDGRGGAQRGRRRRRGRRPRSHRRGRPSCTAASCCASASRTTPTTRRGSSWLAPRRGRRSRRRGAGPFKTSVLFAGAGDVVARLARALPERVRVPRRQPHEDRVAPAPATARPLPVPRRPRGRRARRARPPRRSRDCASTARRFACSGPTRPRRTCR